MESLLGWISQYGYAGLFGLLLLGIVGLPVPDETLLVFSGYLIWRGRLDPRLTFAAGFAGSACGISISYWIGRTLGRPFVQRYGRRLRITEERLDRVHNWFVRIGDWLLAAGYFIPGVRHFTALVAGMSDLEYRRFAGFAYAGAAIWVATFLTLGYLVGEEWQAALRLVHRYTLVLVLLALAAGVVYWFRPRT
ncbi:MAG: DedA family protein [Acidobacteriaceae bacterium]|nr:DedA family protein [Acidobacteriaceae bacterium]